MSRPGRPPAALAPGALCHLCPGACPLYRALAAGPLTSSLSRLTAQPAEGPNAVHFQPKAAPGHGLPGPVSRESSLATGEGLVPEQGMRSSGPGQKEWQWGGEQLWLRAGPLFHVLLGRHGFGVRGQQMGKEHLRHRDKWRRWVRVDCPCSRTPAHCPTLPLLPSDLGKT